MKELAPLIATPYMQWIIGLVAVDAALGIIASLVKGTFRLDQVAKFMREMVIPYIFGFAIIQIIGQEWLSFELLVPAVFVLVIGAVAGSILGNLGRMGLPVPKILKKD